MDAIEKKALALLQDCGFHGGYIDRKWNENYEALCRAIERHEAFAQEVSDAVESLCNTVFVYEEYLDMRNMLRRRFIITKPDPLVEALTELHWAYDDNGCEMADELRKAIEARGLKIVEVGHG